METSMERQRVLATSGKLGTPYEKKLKVASATPRYDPVNTMMACEWHGKEDIRVIERPRPMITEPGDALIKITTTTICGSDLHMYFNQVPGSSVLHSGDVLGHECMGVVENVGPDVRNIKVGDRVVVSAVIADGTCDFCKRQEFSLCDGTNPSSTLDALYGDRIAGILGYTHLCGGYDGGQAEYVRVPLADMNCLPVPETLSDEKVLFLSDIICTGWHGNELAEVKKGDVVAIWGCGPVGLMAAKWALYRGADKVYAIDHLSHRLEIARSIGAEPIDFTTLDPVDFLLKALPNGPDACIDCAGFRFPTTFTHKVMSTLKLETDSLDIVSQMIKCCRKGGHIALIGDYFGVGNGFPIGAFMEKGLTMRGGQVFVQKYWKHLLSLIEAGEFDPTFVITHRMPLGQLSEAYNIFGHAKDDVIKIVLKPEHGTYSTRK